jgi:hypothetical protein
MFLSSRFSQILKYKHLILATLAICIIIALTGIVVSPSYIYQTKNITFDKPQSSAKETNYQEDKNNSNVINNNDLSSLPITFLVDTKQKNGTYPSIDYINQIVRDTDYVAFSENSLLNNPQNHISAIKHVKKGKIIQNFASVKTASEYITYVKDYIDVVSYDLEKWDKSFGEGSSIEKSSKDMRTLVDKYHFQLIGHLGVQLATGRSGNPNSIEDMSKYSDGYGISLYPCLEQYSLNECVSMHKDMANRAKKANPSIFITVTVSVEKNITVNQHYQLLKISAPFIDGIGIFYNPQNPDSVKKFRELVNLIRGVP